MKQFSMRLTSLLLLFVSLPALAEEASLDSGNSAWILTSTALVLFMTLPGLAMFYGGLVRSKNVLSMVTEFL
jgi:Amt family ammonium transporter